MLTLDCAEESWLEATVIESMRPDDLDAVLAIERQCFPSAWSRESYLRELRNRNSHYFVARLGDQIIGYAGMWIVSQEAHISTLAVHPERRRQGLGQRLLRQLFAVARAQRVTRMTLEVRERNWPARQLYRKWGFQEQRLLPRYYGDTGENGVAMEMTLSAENDPGSPR